MIVKIGVVPFNTAARALSTWISPQPNRTKGSALANTAMNAKDRQVAGSIFSFLPLARSIIYKTSEAIPTRAVIKVNGGISRTATLMNRNEGPHKSARKNIHNKTRRPICLTCIHEAISQLLRFSLDKFPGSLNMFFFGP